MVVIRFFVERPGFARIGGYGGRIAHSRSTRDHAATRVRMVAVEGGGVRSRKRLRRVNESGAERLCGYWIPPTYPMHGSTAAIDERIYPEMLSQRIRPAQP